MTGVGWASVKVLEILKTSTFSVNRFLLISDLCHFVVRCKWDYMINNA